MLPRTQVIFLPQSLKRLGLEVHATLLYFKYRQKNNFYVESLFAGLLKDDK
jgi:hypothetical protein